MKFGYFFTMYNTEGHPYGTVLQGALEQSLLVEQAGFNCIWTGEHHFGGEGFDIHPNPIVTTAYLAGKTSTIRLGFAGIIITEWHPLRVAEDVAMVDHLSDGRIECGVGRGITPRELTNLNPLADRRNDEVSSACFLETLEIMKRAWTQDVFTWEGTLYRFPYPGVEDTYGARLDQWADGRGPWRSEDDDYIAMCIVPKPRQQPYPPLWNVLDSTYSFVFAAEHGLKPITWLRSRQGLFEAFSAYREAASRIQGRDLRLGEDCALLRTCFVADSMRKARTLAERSVEIVYSNTGGLRSRQIYADPGEVLSEDDAGTAWFDFLFERDHLLIGTPEFIAEKIIKIQRESGLEYLLVEMWLPGIPQVEIMRSIELFAEGVMPLVKKELAADGAQGRVSSTEEMT